MEVQEAFKEFLAQFETDLRVSLYRLGEEKFRMAAAHVALTSRPIEPGEYIVWLVKVFPGTENGELLYNSTVKVDEADCLVYNRIFLKQ